MIRKIKQFVMSSMLTQKVMWTLLIVFVYMLGRIMPIGTTNLSEVSDESLVFLNNLSIVTGGQFTSMTLFSLGLGPWMSTMIIWRFLTLFNYFKNMTMVQTHISRLSVMFVIALIQAYALTISNTFRTVPILGIQNESIMQLLSMVILISGAYVLMWMGNMNAKKGLGSTTIIILVNMIINFLTNLTSFFAESDYSLSQYILYIGILAAVLSFLIMITVIVYRAEYRIPIKRINVISRFTNSTYLPIRVNPGGGLPFMYGMSLMILPPMLMRGLSHLFDGNETLAYLAENASIVKLPGVMMYIILLFVLSIGFSYYNYDIEEISDNMRKNGDYIENIRPGEETRQYLNYYFNFFVVFGAIFTAVWGGLPLILVLGQSGQVSLALLANNIFIVTSLMLMVIEQIAILRSWKRYKQLI